MKQNKQYLKNQENNSSSSQNSEYNVKVLTVYSEFWDQSQNLKNNFFFCFIALIFFSKQQNTIIGIIHVTIVLIAFLFMQGSILLM